jgi:SAM-dependent methyltransferase
MEAILDRCRACGRPGTSPWRSVGRAGVDYTIRACAGCGSGFVEPRPDLAFLADFYAENGHGGEAPDAQRILAAEAAYPNSTLDAAWIVAAAHDATGGGRFLDIGSGYGFYSREATRAGFDVTALDVAAHDRAVAATIAGIQPIPLLFEDYDAPPGSYDVVLMSHVLEHAQDPEQWLARGARLLRRGGVMAIALPNFGSLTRRILQERDPYICPPVHLNYFTRAGLLALAGRSGLVAVRSRSVSRIPRSAFERRIPVVGGAVHALSAGLLVPVDGVGLGTSLQVILRRN